MVKRIPHFLIWLTMILAVSTCGPGDSQREGAPHQEAVRDRETANRERETGEVRSDNEKSMEWEPEFFVIPESRLGITADERYGLPPDLTPEEDLWIVIQPRRFAKPLSGKDVGVSIRDSQGTLLPLDLQQTVIDSRILGCVSEVSLSYHFMHHSDIPVEIVYSIILPDNAGLSDFMITIGERRIRGVIRERENAEKIYELARDRGLVASLIEDSGDNLIEGRIQSVPPEIEIVSSFRYCATLRYGDGLYRFSCPLTVTHSGSGSMESSKTSITVTLETGMPIRSMDSPTHDIEIVRYADHRAEIRSQSPIRSSPSQFTLEYDISGASVKTALFIDRSFSPGHAVLLMVPPRDHDAVKGLPVDLSIVLDCSRSMRGEKLFTAKKAAEYLLESLDSGDTFRVTTFSGRSLTESRALSAGSNRNIRDTIRNIHAAPSSDGEGMLPGLRKSLTTNSDASRYSLCVILTDGYVDDHADIQRFMDSTGGDNRIFPILVGATANTRLFETMARLGRGGLLYLTPDDDLQKTAESFIATLRRPVLRNITADWKSFGGKQGHPERIPDLHVGRPIVLVARLPAHCDTSLTISGITNTGKQSMEIMAINCSSRAPALGFIWARKHLAALSYLDILSPTTELKNEMANIARQYGIVTPFTSFTVVDTRSGQD